MLDRHDGISGIEAESARVSALIREYGSERMIVDGSADWGVSDPLSLVKTAAFMKQDGHSAESVNQDSV